MTITWTISSRADLETYIENELPDAVALELVEPLIDAMLRGDPKCEACPEYGRDWTEWLDGNASGYLSYMMDQAKDRDL